MLTGTYTDEAGWESRERGRQHHPLTPQSKTVTKSRINRSTGPAHSYQERICNIFTKPSQERRLSNKSLYPRPVPTDRVLPQTSKYERVDPQERVYQQLERAYTAKTEQAAAAKSGNTAASKSKGKRKRGREGEEAAGDGEAVAGGGDAEQKKGGEGRWFD